MPSLTAASAPASVEFTSPTTMTASGRSALKSSSSFIMAVPVCTACVPLPTPRNHVGSGISRSSKKTSDIAAS